jgi:hypothetical protein
MKFVHSHRAPPKVGVNSNIGRVQATQIKADSPIGRALRAAALPPSIAALAAGNESVAPACPVTRSELPPSQPGIKIPFVPKATDLDSAIKAINQIIDILVGGDSGPTIRWLEKERATEIVRITNPDDEDQWVDVERITMLLMEDQITGDLWLWELGPPQGPPPAPSVPAATKNTYYGQTGTVVNPPMNRLGV